ncbi:hypothetical protein IFM89_004886 [Coptis chinensis]|uniref:Uncharacterized protein n=1 Tax=Coptis chinensis TaxID=261450 RepID=A0A835LUJ3_9MAGN|nr:hypothetical protein IFM89_004886 [Coptis chinensis]
MGAPLGYRVAAKQNKISKEMEFKEKKSIDYEDNMIVYCLLILFRKICIDFDLTFQWIAIVRKHAEVIVDDDVILPVFKRYCKQLQKQHNCIPDEHYVQTLLSMNEIENELERRTLTYTLWNQSTGKPEKSAWHPVTFTYAKAGPQQIKEIKEINHVYYETEYRTEWCKTNSTSVPCFLFARKFSSGAAMRILGEGVMDASDVAALVDTHL